MICITAQVIMKQESDFKAKCRWQAVNHVNNVCLPKQSKECFVETAGGVLTTNLRFLSVIS